MFTWNYTTVCKLFGLDKNTWYRIITHVYLKLYKVGDRSRGWPEGSLFDSFYTKV